MSKTDFNDKKIKLPLYVNAYETISSWIGEGKYKAGDKLPNENILAESLSISRGTLRQALLLLQEDGLIINHQGKGNIVVFNDNNIKNGLEKISNTLIDSCKEEITKKELRIQFQTATAKQLATFEVKPLSIISAIDIIYYVEDIPVGFAMIYIPYDIIYNSPVDFENEEDIYSYYISLLNGNNVFSDSRIRLGKAREKTAGILDITQGEDIIILDEIYSEFNRNILMQKLFMKPDYYELHIRRKNDRI